LVLLIERRLSYPRYETGILLVAKALVYSFVNYAIFSLADLPIIEFTFKDGKDVLLKTVIDQNWKSLVIISITASALGIIIGLFKNKDWHMKFARWIGITRRTSRNSIWIDVFHDKCPILNKHERESKSGSYLLVYLKDGRIIYGYPEYFSDDYSEGPALFLTEAEMMMEDSDNVPIPNPGILIMGAEIQYMHFYQIEDK
jgi:hypothetical protein